MIKALLIVMPSFLGLIAACMLTCEVNAQERSPLDPVPFADNQVPDDLKTIVIGTRFVRPPREDVTPTRQFNDFRVPLSEFNDTDHCIDNGTLEVAENYFRTLGRMLEKTGYFFRIPPDDVNRLKSRCVDRHGMQPRALRNAGTSVLAFGRVVPTKDAPELEEALR